MKPTASIISIYQYIAVHYVNPANYAPGVQICHHHAWGHLLP